LRFAAADEIGSDKDTTASSAAMAEELSIQSGCVYAPFQPVRTSFQYTMRRILRGTLMRYFCFSAFTKALLAKGIIKTTCTGGLILFTGSLQ
jgi:hypothetical protein